MCTTGPFMSPSPFLQSLYSIIIRKYTRARKTSTQKTPATISQAAPKFVLFHTLSFKSTRHAINIKAEFMYQALGRSWHIYN